MVQKAMTIRNMAADQQVVVQLLEAQIAPKDFTQCFEFLVATGNRPDDVQVVITLIKEGIRDKVLVDCRSFIQTRR